MSGVTLYEFMEAPQVLSVEQEKPKRNTTHHPRKRRTKIEIMAEREPKKFLQYIEENCIVDATLKKILTLIKDGKKADKYFSKRKYQSWELKPGDWIVKPYSPYLVHQILKGWMRGSYQLKKEVKR